MTPSKQQAIQMALTGDWTNAILYNESILMENPQDTETLNRLAFAYNIVGKVKEAKKTYQQVLEIDHLNPIALRNLKRIGKPTANKQNGKETIMLAHASNIFLEENGKTRIIELSNIAPANITTTLRTGEMLQLSIKRLKIFILDEAKQYIGMLPEDIGARLIKFISGGNKYEAYVKSSDEKKVIIFIRETKRAAKYKDQSSFLGVWELPHLTLEKNTTKNADGEKSKTKDKKQDGDADYPLIDEDES